MIVRQDMKLILTLANISPVLTIIEISQIREAIEIEIKEGHSRFVLRKKKLEKRSFSVFL